jgi:hypothetical protein
MDEPVLPRSGGDQSVQVRGTLMTQHRARASAQNCRPLQDLAVWLPGEGRVYPGLQPLPAPTVQPRGQRVPAQAGAECLAASYDARLQFQDLAAVAGQLAGQSNLWITSIVVVDKSPGTPAAWQGRPVCPPARQSSSQPIWRPIDSG